MDRSDQIARAPDQDVVLEEINLASAEPAAGNSTGDSGAQTELEGAWLALDASVSGRAARQIVGQHLSFRGNRFEITRDGQLCYGGTVSLDSAAVPAALDLDQSESQTLAGVWRGIYQVVGNQLMICDNALDMAKPRPTSFGTSDQDGYVLVRFTREA